MLQDQVNVLVHYFTALLIASVRFSGFALISPVLSGKYMPTMVRVGLILALSGLVTPLVASQMPYKLTELAWVGIVLKELAIGALIGFASGIVFWAAESLGTIIDQQTGSTSAGVFDPVSGHDAGPTGAFLNQFMATIVFVTGVLPVMIGAVYDSYQIWPVFSVTPTIAPHGDFEKLIAFEAQGLAALMTRLTAPFLIALLAIEFGLGLIQKQVSTLDVHSIAQGVKQGVALSLMMILFGAMIDIANSVWHGQSYLRLLGFGFLPR